MEKIRMPEELEAREKQKQQKKYNSNEEGKKGDREELRHDNKARKKCSFRLKVEPGSYAANGQVVVLLGENGTGKSTFIELLAKYLLSSGSHKSDEMSAGTQKNAGKARLAAAKAGLNGDTAAAAMKVNGIVSVKRQHPLERARRIWGGTVREFLDASPVSSAVN